MTFILGADNLQVQANDLATDARCSNDLENSRRSTRRQNATYSYMNFSRKNATWNLFDHESSTSPKKNTASSFSRQNATWNLFASRSDSCGDIRLDDSMISQDKSKTDSQNSRIKRQNANWNLFSSRSDSCAELCQDNTKLCHDNTLKDTKVKPPLPENIKNKLKPRMSKNFLDYELRNMERTSDGVLSLPKRSMMSHSARRDGEKTILRPLTLGVEFNKDTRRKSVPANPRANPEISRTKSRQNLLNAFHELRDDILRNVDVRTACVRGSADRPKLLPITNMTAWKGE